MAACVAFSVPVNICLAAIGWARRKTAIKRKIKIIELYAETNDGQQMLALSRLAFFNHANDLFHLFCCRSGK